MSAERERKQRRRYLETVEQTDARRAVDRSRFFFNVVEMLKPQSRPTVDGLQIVVVSNVVDGSRSPLCRNLKRLHRSVVMLILIYVCSMYCTLLPYSVQRNVVNCQWWPYSMYKGKDCMIIMWIIWHFCTFGLSHSCEPQPRYVHYISELPANVVQLVPD